LLDAERDALQRGEVPELLADIGELEEVTHYFSVFAA
jgi:hypothetical protein